MEEKKKLLAGRMHLNRDASPIITLVDALVTLDRSSQSPILVTVANLDHENISVLV